VRQTTAPPTPNFATEAGSRPPRHA